MEAEAMTRDFLDDFSEALEKEGVAYIVIVQAKDGQSVFVRSDLENWKQGRDCPKSEDIKQLIDSLGLDDD